MKQRWEIWGRDGGPGGHAYYEAPSRADMDKFERRLNERLEALSRQIEALRAAVDELLHR